MIEVERKFVLTEDEQDRLLRGAKLVSEDRIHDVYYDYPDFRLSLADRWLRHRDNGWEMKNVVPGSGGASGYDHFQELTTEADIRESLGLQAKVDFMSDLMQAGFVVIADIVTHRKTYRIKQFTIVTDRVEGTGFELVEIELGVESKDEIAEAQRQISKFASQRGLEERPVSGKVFEYIRQHNPGHYRRLVDAGVVRG